MKILLHACCGPCSLEPVRLLHEAGHELTIAFFNENIEPRGEYDRRRDTLRAWADEQGLPVIEGSYDNDAWHALVDPIQRAGEPREHRCSTCYRIRLGKVARYAAQHGFEGVATTLSVSPYQFAEAIEAELIAACEAAGVTPVYTDFRPFYQQATYRSRELGMYRQNYCGCAYSAAEAERERAERKAERERRKAERAKAEEARMREQAAQRAEERSRREAYDRKQQAKRAARDAIRRQMREAAREPLPTEEAALPSNRSKP